MKRLVLTLATVVVLALVGLAGLLALFVDDFPGVSGDQRVVAPGEPITGRVLGPDGRMRVTLAATTGPYSEVEKDSPVARRCVYDDGRFFCPTGGLAEGAYRVAVRWPSEGVEMVDVVVTGVEGYHPRLVLSEDGEAVLLTGWAPGREVTLTVTDRALALQVAGPFVGIPDENGNLTLRIGKIEAGTYAFDATDGLWSPGDVNNGWDPLFLTV